ncbi:hypothetical protein D3C81_292120 [compost metagenome]
MSKLQQYLLRVSNEDAEAELAALPAEVVEQNEIIQEQELEIPEPDAEITPEIVDDAEFEAEEAAEELEELPAAVEEGSEVEEMVTDEITSIEEFVQVMRHGVRTKAFSPQTAALAQQRLTRLAAMFGDEGTGKASLENFNGESLGEYYNVSIEAFEGFAKRLSDTLAGAADALASKLKMKWNPETYGKFAAEMNAKADQILAATGKDEPVTLKGKHVAWDFQFGGKFDGNIVAALTKDMRFMSGPGAALIKGTDDYLSGIIAILEEGVKDGGKGKTGDIVAKVLQLKRPVDILPEEAFTGAMAGGLKFVKKASKGKEGDNRSNYKDIARSALPDIDGDRWKGDAPDVTLDKATADKIARTCKTYAALALKLANGSALKSVEDFYRHIADVQKRVRAGANTTTWGENKDLNIVASSLMALGQQQFTLLFTMMHTAFNTIESALYTAEKATSKGGDKAIAPADAKAE